MHLEHSHKGMAMEEGGREPNLNIFVRDSFVLLSPPPSPPAILKGGRMGGREGRGGNSLFQRDPHASKGVGSHVLL